jgi:hypothetical protein
MIGLLDNSLFKAIFKKLEAVFSKPIRVLLPQHDH